MWYLLYDQIIKPWHVIDDLVIGSSVYIASGFLKLIGFSIETGYRYIAIIPNGGVWIGDPCNGMDLFALFTVFIIAYPKGNIYQKAICIPSGILLIYLFNVLRIALLVIIQNYFPKTLDFNHTYVFTTFMYLFIFGLWMLWINYFNRK